MTFVSLQALRGLAALGVVLFHLLPFEAKYLAGPTIVPAGFSAGRAGVDLFFVLSGFLAVWTTLGPAGAGAAQRFLLRRVTRIYPTYWFYCIPLLLAWIAAPAGVPGEHSPDVVASLLLIPNAASPLLLVAWTLEFEIYFYLAFALLIWARLARRERILALAAWGGIVVLAHAVLRPTRAQAILDALLSPLVFEFLAGCAAAWLCAAAPRRALTVVAGIVGCGILAIGLLWSETLFALPWLRVAVFGIGAALLLIGCFGEDMAIRRALPGVIVRIGDASYSLYLSHLFTIGAIGHGLARLPSVRLLATPVGHAVILCLTVVAALLVAEASYRWIERPLLRLSRHLIKPPALPHAVSPA
ncbi:MAG: acyltransferase [Acetobacteraceae bacterium]|nr:acyltransferase [Acetobacteraceae bacterium]